MKSFIFKIDHFVAEFFHKIYLLGGQTANTIMEVISYIAEAGILFLILGLGLALFKRTRKIGATILFAVALGFVFTNIILKNTISRARPFSAGGDFWLWWVDAGATSESGHSFPSGHTTATTAFAVAILLTTNKKYNWPILFLPLLMASSRIYLMVHYFSDCVGGIIVGTICATLAYFIVKWIYKSKLKLCVWARELEIFKTKSQKSNLPKQTENVQTNNNPDEFVYTTQSEESASKNDSDETLIQKDIKQTSSEDEDKLND